MIFHIFPYLFYHGFFVGDCSKFCVKKMKSTVVTSRKVCMTKNKENTWHHKMLQYLKTVHIFYDNLLMSSAFKQN